MSIKPLPTDPDWLLARPAEQASGLSIWALKVRAKRGRLRARILHTSHWEFYRPDLLEIAAERAVGAKRVA
jgi:hypothetical protein